MINLTDAYCHVYYDSIFLKVKIENTVYLWTTYLEVKASFMYKVSRKIIISNIRRGFASREKESKVGKCVLAMLLFFLFLTESGLHGYLLNCTFLFYAPFCI